MICSFQGKIEKVIVKKYGEMVTRTSIEAGKYEVHMRELSRRRDFRARFRDIIKQPAEETNQQLTELHLNTGGSGRARAERLFRAIIRTIGVAEVPWFSEPDEVVGVVEPEEEELLMEDSEYDWDDDTDVEQATMQQQAPGITKPSDRGLPTASEMAAVVQTGQGLESRIPVVDRTGPRQHPAPWQDEAGGLPRITVQEERNMGSRRYLRPPPAALREGFSMLQLRHEIPRSGAPPMERSRNKEREADPQVPRGARPKETRHRSRLSVTGRNGESQYDNRTELDDEFLPKGRGFLRRNQLPRDPVIPRQRRKIVPLRESSSSSDDHPSLPLSSSRLRADFRDLSSEGEDKLEGAPSNHRIRGGRGEEPRSSYQGLRRNGRQGSPMGYRDNNLNVITTLKGWGLRYSGIIRTIFIPIKGL